MTTASMEHEMKQKMMKLREAATDPLEKLRATCLMRGASGIQGVRRTFHTFDNDRSKTLNFDEFQKGLHAYGVNFNTAEIKTVFEKCDKDGTGTLNVDEFLVQLRPPMNQTRSDLIKKAFQTLDKTGDGVVNSVDVKAVFSCRKHPAYMNGEMTEEQCLRQFLSEFDSIDKDGQLTEEEFLNYYSGVSAAIERDEYFTMMMKNTWKI